jgi:hypothetical protein
VIQVTYTTSMFANKIFYVSGEIADAHKLQQVLVENGGKICATPTFLSGLNHLVQKEGCLNESKQQESAEQAIFVVVDRFEGDSFHQLCEKNGAQIIGKYTYLAMRKIMNKLLTVNCRCTLHLRICSR